MHHDMFSFWCAAGYTSSLSTSGMNNKDFATFNKAVIDNCLPLPVTVPNASTAPSAGISICPALYCLPRRGRAPNPPDRHSAGGSPDEKLLTQEEDVCLDSIERYLKSHPEVGSILIEIVNASTGVVLSPTFCGRLRIMCDQHRVILICDECLTWGRNGFFMCRTTAYIDFCPHVIIMGKVGLGIVLVKDWNNSPSELNLDKKVRPASARSSYIECSTVLGRKADKNSVRKDPPVSDGNFAGLAEEVLHYIEQDLVKFEWKYLQGEDGREQAWWQGSSVGLKER